MKATLANILKACNECGIPAGLSRRVVRDLGGAKEAAGRLHDVSNHGASGGFSGFIYHTETAAFVRAHRVSILAMLRAFASDMGKSVIEVVRGFNCLCDHRRPAALACDYSADDVGQALYGRVCDADAAILDALAWYALEEVARAWVDAGGES